MGYTLITLTEREVLYQIIRIKLQHLNKKVNREKKVNDSFTQEPAKRSENVFCYNLEYKSELKCLFTIKCV